MRRVLPLLLLALLFSCKRSADKTATPTPAPAPESPNARRVSSTSMSWLHPMGGNCVWEQHDPVLGGDPRELASIPGACESMHTAWSPDGAKGIVWVDDGEKSQLHEVTFGQTKATERPAPPNGDLRDVGYDGFAALIALTLQPISDADRKKGSIEVDGKSLAIPREMDGIPVIAEAWRFEGGAWKRFEAKVSDDAWDLAIGVRALEAAKQLGPRSWEVLGQPPEGDSLDPQKDAALVKKLDAACSPGRDLEESTQWVKLAENAFVLEEAMDFVVVMPKLCFLDGANAIAAKDLEIDENDSISVQTRSNWALITTSGGEHPHLYDLAARKRVWASAPMEEAVFWPQ